MCRSIFYKLPSTLVNYYYLISAAETFVIDATKGETYPSLLFLYRELALHSRDLAVWHSVVS